MINHSQHRQPQSQQTAGVKRRAQPLSPPPSNRTQPGPSSTGRIVAQIGDDGRSDFTKRLLKDCEARMSNRSLQAFSYPFIHDVGTCYEKLCKIGQGTFGEVFKARCKRSMKMVALKKILMENEREGFPITAIREVKMLQRLKDKHITELVEICNTKCPAPNDKSTFYLVFTFCNCDLAGLLSRKDVRIGLADVKTMMKHLLEGLLKIHHASILHRDMKAANVLISEDGILRLADFGLSRQMLKSGKPGGTEQMQLDLIQQTCGGINPTVWPDVTQLPLYNRIQLKPDQPRTLQEKMMKFEKDESALDLLGQLLTLDPAKRPSAETALIHRMFFANPKPTENIKHILTGLPNNIFEFTAGRGAHANRRPQHQMAAGGGAMPSSMAANGRARMGGRPAENQMMHDVIY
ncbi:putative cyclin-dependent kinase 9 [Aphelenchoides fujianensis]|nr:putative cyclin-dependent kinase 9 [Aphelenchoides fujianensis]